MTTEPISIVRNIVMNELGLEPERIWVYNADVPLPKDNNLFCILFVNYRRPFSNNVKYENFTTTVGDVTTEGLNEHQTMNVLEDITVSLLSKNDDARQRSYEVQMALGSTYSQQQQENEAIHISRIGRVVDASFLEATSRLNRFDTDIIVLCSYEKIKAIDYYDKFPVTSKFEPEIITEP